jgi:hypothetical protein
MKAFIHRVAPLIFTVVPVLQAAAQAPVPSQPPISFDTSQPFIQLDDEGGPAKLLYTIPEPTSYPGRFFLILDDVASFNASAYQELEESQVYCRKANTLADLLKARPAGSFLPYSLRINPALIAPAAAVGAPPKGTAAAADDNAGLPNGARLILRKSLFGTQSVQLIPCGSRQPPSVARLMIVESYRLTSFAGDYGAGRTIKTFTLFPGEKTTVTVKTYQRSKETRQQASSILDSFSESSANDFEDSISAENSNKQAYSESQEYKADIHAEQGWGSGKASVNASAAIGMNALREEFSKNVRNAVNKHSNSASSKRDVSVTSSSESTQESGEETETRREVENINVSRTLNLVFRQMNQRFVSVLHLTDIRIGYYRRTFKENNAITVYKEVPLSELKPFLDEVLTDQKARDQVASAVKRHFNGLRNYNGEQVNNGDKTKDFVIPVDSETWQVNPAYKSKFKDPITGKDIPMDVPGVVVSGSANVLRTDGVIVEAVLGQGNALDAYSMGLQDEAVRQKKFENEKEALRLKIINDKDIDKAKLFEQIYREPLGSRPTKPGAQ